MAEISRMAKGNFTATGTTAVVPLPFVPDYVEIWNYSNIKTKANSTVTRAYWDSKLLDGSNNPTMIEGYSSAGALIYDQISNASTNLAINPYYAGLALQYGPAQAITTVTGSASPTVVTTTNPHGYQVGDTVIMSGIAVGTTNNMQLLNNVPFTISAVGSTTTFSVKWDSSGGNYTTVSPTAATVKKVLYPFIYVPEDNVVSNVSQAAQAVVTTTMYHNFEVGQEVAFRMPTFWGMTQLNSLPNNVIPGSPVYGYVVSVTDNWTFVVNINTSGYSAFSNNGAMTASTLFGLTYAQTLAVGDVNSGGNITGISATQLYPPPYYPTSTNRVPTINGPAIRGAFTNNTTQGFTIGAGLGAVITASTGTITASTNIIYWHAYLHDYGNP